MMLPALQLDDLTWRSMVDAIRSRIAGVSNEEWTLHAPVDPGVTLLELFAQMLEQRVYWLDQVSDPLINALIALLGAKPRSAQASTTVLEVAAGPPVIERGAVFEMSEGDFAVKLATRDDLAVLPVERIDVSSAFGAASTASTSQPRWAMQPLTLLPASRDAADVRITLWLRMPPAREQWGKSFALLLELDTPSRIAAGWAVDAVDDVPAPAALEWSYGVAGSTTMESFAPEAVSDGTQGLRRSGVVRFAIPEQWTSVQDPVRKLYPLQLRLHTERSAFSAPPRLRRVVPNSVAAIHAVPVAVPWEEIEKQVREWLPLPGLKLRLADRSPPLESSVSLRLLGRDNVWRDWVPTADFVRHGPEDAVFTVDREANCLRFGNGLMGRLPVLRAGEGSKATLHYLAGGGESGRLGGNLNWTAGPPTAANAINAVPVRGGQEAETAGEARDRVSAELYQPFRAVTARDYETLVVGTRGVAIARAHAASGSHPAFPCVSIPGALTLFVVPEVPRNEGWQGTDHVVTAPQPDPGMLALVSRQLDERRLLTAEIFVRGPVYREVAVSATLSGLPVDRSDIGQNLREGLATYLDALKGGAEGTGWPFGQPVRPSEIAHLLQQLAGEAAEVTEVAVRLVDPAKPDTAFERCVDLAIGPHDLVVLRSLDLKWQASTESSGGLR